MLISFLKLDNITVTESKIAVRKSSFDSLFFFSLFIMSILQSFSLFLSSLSLLSLLSLGSLGIGRGV